MISYHNENGPGAAATAHGAGIVASLKPTGSDNPNPEKQQSRMVAASIASPDNTGRKQALRLSLRDAVNAKCKSCIYDPFGGCGTWREQVQACSSANCPLHSVRPMAVKAPKAAPQTPEKVSGGSGGSIAPDALRGRGLALNGQTATDRRAA